MTTQNTPQNPQTSQSRENTPRAGSDPNSQSPLLTAAIKTLKNAGHYINFEAGTVQLDGHFSPEQLSAVTLLMQGNFKGRISKTD